MQNQQIKNETINSNLSHVDSRIIGFKSSIIDEDKFRIDNFVDEYEKSILIRLRDEYKNNTSRSDKVADKIAKFGGSWKFIIILAAILILWLIWNSISILPHFDEKPFVLLNLILSFTAAFQAPIIMMSQNRKATQDKKEAIIDFAINYKSEKEIEDMQGHLHKIELEIYKLKEMLKE